MSGIESTSTSVDSDSASNSNSLPPTEMALRNRTNRASENFSAKIINPKERTSTDLSKENVFEPIKRNKRQHENGETETTESSLDNDMDVDEDDTVSHATTTTSKISLIATPKEKKEEQPNATLPAELLTLVSSLYLDVTKRLCLQTPFRCATELTFCYNNHYRTEKPEAPYHTQVSNLRCTWQQARYVEFINTAADMCTRSEFPGEGVFTKLIELILSTNYERNESKSPRQAYISIVRLFRSIVNTFPPCWLAMRPHYIKFFRQGLDIKKLVLKTKDIITNSNKIVGILFDLIEYTFNNYTEMIINSEEQRDKNCSQESVCESTAMKSQCFSQWNWDELDTNSTAFCNIKTDSRLERINVVLGLLLHILETDLCMWILHHHRSPKQFMFDEEKAPLVVLVFEISQSQRSTRLVRRLFEIFSKAVAMDLNKTHLKLVERWISLVMVASHAADLEDSVIGIRFPALQSKTRELIKDFYRHFKKDNLDSLETYFTCIDLLRVPYVKYEFIDLFLQMFHHPSNESISPSKIANVIVRKIWLKYKPKAELNAQEQQEKLSREQYFELLLKALNAYCEMHGLERLFQHLCSKDEIPALQTVSESAHRYANGGTSDRIILLEEMAKDRDNWLKQLRMDVRMSRPKVNLPPAEIICIDKDVIASYRSDLKYCTLLAQTMMKHAKTQSTGVRDKMLEFASKYKL